MYTLAKTTSDSLEEWLKELKEFQLDGMFDMNILGRAYLYTDSISILEKDQLNISGRVQEKDYQMHIKLQDQFVYGECSCPFDGPCKHLAALLLISLNKP